MANIHTVSDWPYATTLRGFDEYLFYQFMERPEKSETLLNIKDSSQYQEDIVTAGGGGIMPQKLEGQALEYDELNEGFRKTFTHLDYGLAKRVTRNLLRDDMSGTMDEIAEESARQARATRETLRSNHLNRAFSSSYTGPDGKELCATNHIRENGTVYSNELTNAADLSMTSLEQAEIDFSDIRDGGGKRVQVEPRYLVVSKENRFIAHRLLKSQYDPENDSNAVNPQADVGLEPCVWNYLTDTDAWFLFADKSEHRLCVYEREAPWSDYDFDFNTKDYRFSLMFAESSGWADPRGIFGSPGV